MDRLELIREIVDEHLEKIQDVDSRRFAYLHTYGVSQSATILAKLRNANIELCSIAAMLHDIALYVLNCPHAGHAQKSAILAKEILENTHRFEEDEILSITSAIALHSEKMQRSGALVTEILKDADVLQHYLYNVNIEISTKDSYRLFYLLEELTCKNVQSS